MINIFAKVKNKITHELYKLRAPKEFDASYEVFLKTGITPPEGHKALIELYCSTNGRINDRMQEKIRLMHPMQDQTMPITGVLGTLEENDFDKANTMLNNDGYFVFDKKLPKETVSKLYEYALATPAFIPPGQSKKVVYDPLHPVAEIYRFAKNDLINNADIQALAMDPTLINIARNYFGCEPIFDDVSMWWSDSLLKKASVEAAQLYHFDLDRIKWLKIFIYLNDVTSLNGSHNYIRGSHKAGSKPRVLLKRGYCRIPDADVRKYYPAEDFREITGTAGSIFAGDTKCWHKGGTLKEGNRLVLEFQYASSLFGTNYPKLKVKDSSDSFKKFCGEKKVYSESIEFEA